MTDSGRRRRRILLLALAALGSAFLAWFGTLAWDVWTIAQRDEARTADVIVVFGAAEYRGRPSPVLKARLDHALELHRRHIAGRLITTGGPGGDPHFTEGGVGRNYLVQQGVPPEDILFEDESTSTAETVLAVAEIMARHNWQTCVVVSDGYHIFRIQRLFESKGIQAYGSPREATRPMPFFERLAITVKQVLGYMLWRAGIRV